MQCKNYAIVYESAIAIRNGFETLLVEVEVTLLGHSSERTSKDASAFWKICIEALKITLEIGSLQTLCKPLNEHFRESSEGPLYEGHQTTLLPALAYICEIFAPKLQIDMNEDAIVVDKNGYKLIQRAVAADSFYGFTMGRFETVLATKSYDRHDKYQAKKSLYCLIANVLQFLTI